MKLKFLLLFFLIANVIWAQEAQEEPYRNLVFSEAFMCKSFNDVYFEFTNMGDTGIDLSEISFNNGFATSIFDPWNDEWVAGNSNYRFFLPESVARILQPGESFVITIALDYGVNMFKARIPEWGWANRAKQHDIYQYADFLAHRMEADQFDVAIAPHVKDSITSDIKIGGVLNTDDEFIPTIGYCNFVNIGLFITHHYADGDSAAIDQVGMTFENSNGTSDNIPDAVAGVSDATANALLVRQSNVKVGNLDFNSARGVGLDDSEWIAITYPEGADNWRDTWWTVGNHGNFVLDENTLKPKNDNIKVDFGAKTISVPWGTRRLDDIMRNMEYSPGLAWIYHLNELQEDSLLRSAQNGDKLTVYVVGETLTQGTFDITVKEPTQDANIVIPVDHKDLGSISAGGSITYNVQNGELGWPRVTNHTNGIDTITGGGYGLPHATRTDTLLQYLEKPANANWEIVFVDGIERADLKTGDMLKVTAQNGDTKEYFIEVQGYTPSHNANLSSITWPDVDLSLDGFYKEIMGWTGDTIPKFSQNITDYRLVLPFDIKDIPALTAKTQDLNASVTTKRASSYEGSIAGRTISFEVIAEDDSVKNVYNIELQKEKDPVNVQPFSSEPFVSEIVRRMNQNSYIEICNPGNQMLDLSNYMMCVVRSDVPSNAITQLMGAGDWLGRYRKYVPGYKWVGLADWQVTPGILEQELSVNPLVLPGDVFVMGNIKNDDHVTEDRGYAGGYEKWWIPGLLDVQFQNTEGTFGNYTNPWSEDINNGITAIPHSFTESFYLFKILNDSIKRGLKPANDPNDFELIDALGMEGNARWFNGDHRVQQRTQYTRKPEIVKGNPVIQASFGTNADDTEWIVRYRSWYSSRGIPGGTVEAIMTSDLGQHFFTEPTAHLSTISALVYKVSPGYTNYQNIRGIITGTTATEFLDNIYKADEGQTLKIKSVTDGNELAADALLSLNDTLVVLSADSTNTTMYLLQVDESGLSSNAILTSDRFDIAIISNPKSAGTVVEPGSGTVTGFEYGTQLKTIVDNVEVPAGARMTVINSNGAYVPLKTLNFDTTYVFATVNSDMYIEVVAEDGATTIVYQLLPELSQSDVFVTSEVYSVDQRDLLVEFVPRGTAVQSFVANVIPSLGASMKLVDKFGLERTVGNIVEDDKLIVTSPDGTQVKVYFLSMLATEFVPQTTYLAYITSSRYGIDQVDNVIYGVNGNTLVSDFYSRISPSMGATAVLVDANGNEKLSGDIDGSDMVKVTSIDGKITVMYEFGTLVGVNVSDYKQLELYPNPTDSRINITGLDAGNRIKVFNSTGAMLRDVISTGNTEMISLNGEASGLYLIVISNKNELLGRFKAVKK